MIMKHLWTALLIFSAVLMTATDASAQKPTFANVPYVTGGGERQQLDIYLPANWQEAEKLPVLVWIHGGAWYAGSKDGLPGREFLAQGYACVSINYRLSQQAVFPAQIEDCKAAIRWLRANAGTYHLDPEKIGVWGSSAGGHLAAMLGTTGHVKDFDVGENLDQSSVVQAVCDFFGPADFFTFRATSQARADKNSPEAKLIGGSIAEKPELAALASPVTHVTKEASPFLIFHGTNDQTVPVNQGQGLYDALKAAGADAEVRIVEGAGHNMGQFTTPEGKEAIARFFERCLKE